MSDEIKEILDKLKETADYPKLNYSSYDKSYNETIDNVAMIKSFACKQLLDYITNLQKENDRLSNIINELEEYCKEEYYRKNTTDIDSIGLSNNIYVCIYMKLKELKENK